MESGLSKILIPNDNQEMLAAYFFPPQLTARYIMIVCHGFRGAKENGGRIFSFAQRVSELNIGVLAFDFTGCGESAGEFSSLSLSRQARDLHSVLEYVDSKFGLPIILLGRSFGGSTVLAGASGNPQVAGYIFWSTPVFMERTFAAILADNYRQLQQGTAMTLEDDWGQFDLQPDMVLDFPQHDMTSYLAAIGERPVLIVHASDDEIVPPDNARFLHGKLNNSRLYMIEGAGHRFLEKTAVRENITMEWLQAKFGE